MKKHIIIAGVPRAGKSTLSDRVARELGYQHISMDSVIAGFERCFPDLGVNTYQNKSSEETMRIISTHMAPFIQAMVESGEYDEHDYGMLIDMYQLLPSDYAKHIDTERVGAIWLVTSDVSYAERLAIQLKYDTPKDYTYGRPIDELAEGCRYIVDQSKIYRAECEALGLPFFETARDRESALDRAFEYIKSM